MTMQRTDHLTSIPDGTLLAWHTTDDVQAVRVDGEERLYVSGQFIPLTEEHHHPTQQIINYCHEDCRGRQSLRRFWIKLRLADLRKEREPDVTD